MEDESSPMESRFAVRIVDIDFEITKPNAELDPLYSPLTGKRLSRVPVVRIFGSTPRGQKACLHVHGAFRYFFVPHVGQAHSDESLRRFLKHLAEELDDELAVHAAMSNSHREAAPEYANTAWVYDMSIVHLTPFYGYHEEVRALRRLCTRIND